MQTNLEALKALCKKVTGVDSMSDVTSGVISDIAENFKSAGGTEEKIVMSIYRDKDDGSRDTSPVDKVEYLSGYTTLRLTINGFGYMFIPIAGGLTDNKSCGYVSMMSAYPAEDGDPASVTWQQVHVVYKYNSTDKKYYFQIGERLNVSYYDDTTTTLEITHPTNTKLIAEAVYIK